jgi:hypothetical protein
MRNSTVSLSKKQINLHVILKTVLFTLLHNTCLDYHNIKKRSADINFHLAKSKRRKGLLNMLPHVATWCCQPWKQEKT